MPAPDYLNVAGSPLEKLLSGEAVVFSDTITKINRKGKAQPRSLVISNKNIYNVKGKSVKRKIALDKVSAIVRLKGTEEFVFKVPDEYDYHYKSDKSNEICEIIKANTTLEINDTDSLKGQIITKHHKGHKDRFDKMQLARAEAAVEVPSDEEDRKKAQAGAEVSPAPEINLTSMGGSEGKKVGIQDFELLKVLGRGAFGKVMQVRKIDSGKVYAMKILKKGAIIQRNQVEHTQAERKILETLQHPFLMTLRYAFQSKEKLYLVLDYYQGGELFFHLKDQRRFSEEVARIYVAEIAMAFGHLHVNDIIYRDLKPENILLDNDGHVCITDFGLAKEVGKGEKTSTFCGTPEYLAPEIIASNGHDKAVDWWALGILLYELTVGIPPFYSQNVNEMYQKIQQGVLRFPPFLSEHCKSLIVALLNRKPAERLGSANGFEDIKAHPFFQDLKTYPYCTANPDVDIWDAVFQKKIVPDFKPQVKGTEDVSNFDEEFLSEPVVDSVVAPSQYSGNQAEPFKDFTFKGAPGHLG